MKNFVYEEKQALFKMIFNKYKKIQQNFFKI